jgi:hypothetical protein
VQSIKGKKQRSQSIEWTKTRYDNHRETRCPWTESPDSNTLRTNGQNSGQQQTSNQMEAQDKLRISAYVANKARKA